VTRYYVDSGVSLEQVSGVLRVLTGSGYVNIGPANTAWCHFTTDRAKFYFGSPVTVVNSLDSYDGPLVLSREGSSTSRITIDTSYVATHDRLYVNTAESG